jgi:hypothetical protein
MASHGLTRRRACHSNRYKRSCVTMRIPESVLNRVYRRMCGQRVA